MSGNDVELVTGLLDSDPDEPEIWMAESEGEQLVGTVDGVGFGYDDKYKRDVVAVVVRDAGGQLWSWTTGQAVPVRTLRERGVQVGDVLAARFLGVKKSGQDREYKDWRIKIMRGGQVVRARLGAGDGAEPKALSAGDESVAEAVAE